MCCELQTMRRTRLSWLIPSVGLWSCIGFAGCICKRNTEKRLSEWRGVLIKLQTLAWMNSRRHCGGGGSCAGGCLAFSGCRFPPRLAVAERAAWDGCRCVASGRDFPVASLHRAAAAFRGEDRRVCGCRGDGDDGGMRCPFPVRHPLAVLTAPAQQDPAWRRE